MSPSSSTPFVRRSVCAIAAAVAMLAVAGCSDTPVRDVVSGLPTTVVDPAATTVVAPPAAVDTAAPVDSAAPVETVATTVAPVETPAPTAAATEAPTVPVASEPATVPPPATESSSSPWWPWVLVVSLVVLAVALIARRRAAPPASDAPPGPLVTQWQARALQATTDVESAAALLFAAPTSGLAPERWSLLLRQTMRMRGELAELQRTAPSPLLAGSIGAVSRALDSLELASEADVSTARPSEGQPLPPTPALLEAHRRVSLALSDVMVKINPTPTPY